MTKTTAIGYVRVSRVGGRGGDSFLSPELQRQSIERVCQREGLTLVDVLEELDKSGGDANRPLWNQAIERVERGEVGALVVWNLDRFSRSVIDALAAIDRISAAGGGSSLKTAQLEGSSGRSCLRLPRTTGVVRAIRSSELLRTRSSAASTRPRTCRPATRVIQPRGGSC